MNEDSSLYFACQHPRSGFEPLFSRLLVGLPLRRRPCASTQGDPTEIQQGPCTAFLPDVCPFGTFGSRTAFPGWRLSGVNPGRSVMLLDR